MSFDALLSLLFILLFVVGPLLRRISGSKQKPPPTTGRRPPPPVQTESGGERAEGGGPLESRLEEARRRVLEAMGDPESSRGEAGGQMATPSSQPPPERELDWQASAKPVQPFLLTREQAERQREAAAARVVGPAPAETDVTTRRRRRERQPIKMRSGRLPALDRNGVLGGMIWHEILSEPVSERGTRRAKSRLRSR